MKAKLLIFIILPVVLLSCGRRAEQKDIPESTIVVDFDSLNYSDTVRFSEIFDRFTIVPLETNSENLTSGLGMSIRVVNERIYLFQRAISQGDYGSIDIYSIDGAFLRRISNPGRGPGEHLRMGHFDVDPNNSDVYILESARRKVLRYSGVDGTHIETIDLPLNNSYQSLSLTGSGDFLLFVGNKVFRIDEPHFIYLIDREGKIIEEHLPFSQEGLYYTEGRIAINESNLFRANDGTRVFWQFNSTVYNYSEGRVYPYFTVTGKNHEDRPPSRNAFDGTSGTGIIGYMHDNGVSLFKHSRLWGFYYHKTGRTISSRVLYDDLTKLFFGSLSNANGTFSTMFEGNIVALYHIISPLQITIPNYYSSGGSSPTKPTLYDHLKSGEIEIDEDTRLSLIDRIEKSIESGGGVPNPIVLIYRFK